MEVLLTIQKSPLLDILLIEGDTKSVEMKKEFSHFGIVLFLTSKGFCMFLAIFAKLSSSQVQVKFSASPIGN